MFVRSQRFMFYKKKKKKNDLRCQDHITDLVSGCDFPFPGGFVFVFIFVNKPRRISQSWKSELGFCLYDRLRPSPRQSRWNTVQENRTTWDTFVWLLEIFKSKLRFLSHPANVTFPPKTVIKTVSNHILDISAVTNLEEVNSRKVILQWKITPGASLR